MKLKIQNCLSKKFAVLNFGRLVPFNSAKCNSLYPEQDLLSFPRSLQQLEGNVGDTIKSIHIPINDQPCHIRQLVSLQDFDLKFWTRSFLYKKLLQCRNRRYETTIAYNCFTNWTIKIKFGANEVNILSCFILISFLWGNDFIF